MGGERRGVCILASVQLLVVVVVVAVAVAVFMVLAAVVVFSFRDAMCDCGTSGFGGI